MYRVCIAVVDASRARLFMYERSAEVEGISDEVSEQRDLVNPVRRLRPSQMFSDTRPGSSRTGGVQYGLDDRRDAHIDELDAEFARLVMGELRGLVDSSDVQLVIVCASPHMLGKLRTASNLSPALSVEEIPRDLVKLTPPQLRKRLAAYGVLPAVPSRAHA